MKAEGRRSRAWMGVLGVLALSMAFSAMAPARAATAEERRAASEARRLAAELRRAEQRAQREADRAARPDPRGAAQADRAARTQGCERIAAWLSETQTRGIPPAVLARRFEGGRAAGAASAALQVPYESWLLQDARFAPAFGARFDEVPAGDRQGLQRAGNNCPSPRNARGQAIADNMLFFRAFDARYHPRYVQGVVAIRAAHARVDAALKALQGLGADDAGARRLRELAADRAELEGFLDADARAAYRQAFEGTYRRALQPLYDRRLRQAAAGAQGYEGLATLAALQTEMQRDAYAAGASAHAAVPPEVKARRTALAQALVAEEQARIDALGAGPAGLERGVQWHAEHLRRYDARLTGAAPELRAILAHFEQRRAPVLDAAMPELSRQIQATRSEAQLQALLDRYVPLESDRRHAALTARVAEQRDALHKRGILGGGGGGGSAAAPAPTAPGEPSESDMYDAFNARLQAINEEMQDVAKRCNNRAYRDGAGDPVLAMQCLQFGIAVGVTRDGQNVGAPQFKVSRFQKIACEKAQGEPGYRCDYVAGMSGNVNMPPALAALTRNGEMTQARFVRQAGGWLLIPRSR